MSNSSVLIIMGSVSDNSVMEHCANILAELNIKYEVLVISAHRTPDRLFKFAKEVVPQKKSQVIIAGAGGAAHLPGMVASLTHIPVLGVPITSNISGLDSLFSIVQMPGGVPVASFAIGKAGAINAALFAAAILALNNPQIEQNLIAWRQKQTESVPLSP